ncbi:MAG: AAA family ATPase, partial [Verrucomicrobiales bacterium]
MTENIYNESDETPDRAFEHSLRPPAFDDFCGQQKVKDRLMLMVEAAKRRGDTLGHILLSGPPGLGKTSLAHIIATAVGSKIHIT